MIGIIALLGHDLDGRDKGAFARRPNDFARQGVYTSFYANGQKREAAAYDNDTLHGQRIFFYETGDTQFVAQLVRGEYEGLYREYYEDGTLKQTGQYVGNEMSGQWKTYYPNGQLKEVVPFVYGAENGPFVEYHENGQLSAEGAKLDGDNDHGSLKLYDEAGQLFREMDCVRGRCHTVWLREDMQGVE
jgi:antitoxin component YwqK of YwqJK toxin-antitoxin module